SAHRRGAAGGDPHPAPGRAHGRTRSPWPARAAEPPRRASRSGHRGGRQHASARERPVLLRPAVDPESGPSRRRWRLAGAAQSPWPRDPGRDVSRNRGVSALVWLDWTLLVNRVRSIGSHPRRLIPWAIFLVWLVPSLLNRLILFRGRPAGRGLDMQVFAPLLAPLGDLVPG